MRRGDDVTRYVMQGSGERAKSQGNMELCEKENVKVHAPSFQATMLVEKIATLVTSSAQNQSNTLVANRRVMQEETSYDQ
jgi:hypothetical protein